jgi:hypothetical protein
MVRPAPHRGACAIVFLLILSEASAEAMDAAFSPIIMAASNFKRLGIK